MNRHAHLRSVQMCTASLLLDFRGVSCTLSMVASGSHNTNTGWPSHMHLADSTNQNQRLQTCLLSLTPCYYLQQHVTAFRRSPGLSLNLVFNVLSSHTSATRPPHAQAVARHGVEKFGRKPAGAQMHSQRACSAADRLCLWHDATILVSV